MSHILPENLIETFSRSQDMKTFSANISYFHQFSSSFCKSFYVTCKSRKWIIHRPYLHTRKRDLEIYLVFLIKKKIAR